MHLFLPHTDVGRGRATYSRGMCCTQKTLDNLTPRVKSLPLHVLDYRTAAHLLSNLLKLPVVGEGTAAARAGIRRLVCEVRGVHGLSVLVQRIQAVGLSPSRRAVGIVGPWQRQALRAEAPAAKAAAGAETAESGIGVAVGGHNLGIEKRSGSKRVGANLQVDGTKYG